MQDSPTVDVYLRITAEDEAAGRPSSAVSRMKRAADEVVMESQLHPDYPNGATLDHRLSEEERWQLDPSAEAARQADEILAGRRLEPL